MENMNKTRKNNDTVFVVIAMVIFVTIAFACAIIKNISLQERIEAQDIIIAQHEKSEDLYEETFELYEEYFELEIDKALLEERIKWLESQNIIDYQFATQMYEDFMQLYILHDSYGGNNFEAWVEITNPELYERITIYEYMFD